MSIELPERQILTVSQLNRRTRLLLETHLPLLWVRGEISNFSCPGSGHWYFTLKDAQAQIRCAMFRNRNQRLAVQPGNGDQVLIRGRVGLYENRGEYQLIAEHLEADGAGLLQQRFEALKAKLLQEGLFEPEFKKSLPPFPCHIGIITSPTGAAVRDVLHVLKRRCPWVEVTIFPTAVQGQEAVPQIVRAVEIANTRNDCEVLIITRGGGSLEDLWVFNEEAVARAIFASTLPIVSAIGHETDFTISDFVADVRAPTPSAAAEIVSPDRDNIRHRVEQQERYLLRQLRNTISHYQHVLTGFSRRLRSPADKLREQTQQLDHLEVRLRRACHRELSEKTSLLKLLVQRLQSVQPGKQLELYQQNLILLYNRMYRCQRAILQEKGQRLSALASTLNAVSPLNTLERGYSIARDRQQKIIRSISEVSLGDEITVRVTDGRILCDVTGKQAIEQDSPETGHSAKQPGV